MPPKKKAGCARADWTAGLARQMDANKLEPASKQAEILGRAEMSKSAVQIEDKGQDVECRRSVASTSKLNLLFCVHCLHANSNSTDSSYTDSRIQKLCPKGLQSACGTPACCSCTACNTY